VTSIEVSTFKFESSVGTKQHYIADCQGGRMIALSTRCDWTELKCYRLRKRKSCVFMFLTVRLESFVEVSCSDLLFPSLNCEIHFSACL
jgi:hypothetical protein